MKEQQKKKSSAKKDSRPLPQVKRSKKATGVNEEQKNGFPRRTPFADEMGTAVPDPNKVIR